MNPIFRPAVVLLLMLTGGAGRAGRAAEAGVRVDADFPGGNVLVQRIEGDTVWLAPDLRDTQANQWWFYWHFRLRAPAGRPVTVVFRERNPLGVRGPAMSRDGGVTWRWLGAEAVTAQRVDGKPAWSFVAQVPAGAADVRYAFSPQYLESHLQAWAKGHDGHPALRREELTRSRRGRSVELLRAGCLEPAQSRGVVLLTARHHCCEAMASYALEGWLDAVLADDATGRRWRANWEVLAVPFVDKDGVESGDQGKNRTPHDHNRDYNAAPLYPEVAALMGLGGAAGRRVVAAVDLHCPHIRGEWNDRVYLVGSPAAAVWRGQREFAAVWARTQTGMIRFRAEDCLAYGTAWNTANNTRQGRSFAGWATAEFPGARLVTTIEIPYADALGVEVSAASARALGRDLARALAEFLDARGEPALPLPPRPADAPGGTELVARLAPLDRPAWEAAIVAEVRRGNVPEFWRHFVVVTLDGAEFFAAPDYLAVGADEDYFLAPLSPPAAQLIADQLGCSLPTRRMVDAIHRAAPLKLEPAPIPPSAEMTSMRVFAEHNATVRAQRFAARAAHPPGTLVAGHKKDVVLSPRLSAAPGRVAIYGWHRPDGTAIQPLYLGHAASWVDYSHGVRLVWRELRAGGIPTTVAAVLADARQCGLLSDEGPMPEPHYPREGPAAARETRP